MKYFAILCAILFIAASCKKEEDVCPVEVTKKVIRYQVSITGSAPLLVEASYEVVPKEGEPRQGTWNDSARNAYWLDSVEINKGDTLYVFSEIHSPTYSSSVSIILMNGGDQIGYSYAVGAHAKAKAKYVFE